MCGAWRIIAVWAARMQAEEWSPSRLSEAELQLLRKARVFSCVHVSAHEARSAGCELHWDQNTKFSSPVLLRWGPRRMPPVCDSNSVNEWPWQHPQMWADVLLRHSLGAFLTLQSPGSLLVHAFLCATLNRKMGMWCSYLMTTRQVDHCKNVCLCVWERVHLKADSLFLCLLHVLNGALEILLHLWHNH